MMHEKKDKQTNGKCTRPHPFLVWQEQNQYHVNVNIPLILETVALQLTEMLSSYPPPPPLHLNHIFLYSFSR